MYLNKAYTHLIERERLNRYKKIELREHNKEKYKEYRYNWTNSFYVKNKTKTLSVDNEIAAICDLAGPHCHREFLVTPDKIINFDFNTGYKQICIEHRWF